MLAYVKVFFLKKIATWNYNHWIHYIMEFMQEDLAFELARNVKFFIKRILVWSLKYNKANKIRIKWEDKIIKKLV